jgi:hypothetical protein
VVLLASPIFAVDSIPTGSLVVVESLCGRHAGYVHFKDSRIAVGDSGAGQNAADNCSNGSLPGALLHFNLLDDCMVMFLLGYSASLS